MRDIFGFQRLEEKIYTTAQIDGRWTLEMFDDFLNWFKTDEKAQAYSYLDWTEDLEELKKWIAEHPQDVAAVTL